MRAGIAAGAGEVDTSPAFASVRAAVEHFQLQPEEIELIRVEEETVKLEMELFVKERETLKILEELDVTKRTAARLMQELNTTSCVDVTLLELKHAKILLHRSTAETLKSKIEAEATLLARTREKFYMNKAKALALERSLSDCRDELNVLKSGSWLRMKQLRAERDGCKKIADEYRREISQLTAEIELGRSRLKSVEFRITMASKMKEAAKSAEAVVAAGMKAHGNDREVTMSVDEHELLVRRAQEADVISRRKIEAAARKVQQAKQSKLKLMEKMEEAERDLRVSRRAMEEAMKKEELAKKAKLAADEALQRKTQRFKNSTTAAPRKPITGILDVNGMHLIPSSRLGMTMSIGEILNWKVMARGYEATREKKVSLAQILSQSCDGFSPASKPRSGTKTKLRSVALSFILARQK